MEIKNDTLENGIPYFSGTTPEPNDYSPILEPLSETNKLFWLLNAKAARLELETEIAGEDLLEHFPAEIKNDKSLYLIENVNSEKIPQWEQFIANDAAICISATADAGDLIASLKFMIAWFVKPSALKFHLENGANTFIEQLFADLNFVFLPLMGGPNWIVFVDPKNPMNAEELGLPAPANVRNPD